MVLNTIVYYLYQQRDHMILCVTGFSGKKHNFRVTDMLGMKRDSGNLFPSIYLLDAKKWWV